MHVFEASSVDWITVLVCITNVDRLTTVTSDTCHGVSHV